MVAIFLSLYVYISLALPQSKLQEICAQTQTAIRLLRFSFCPSWLNLGHGKMGRARVRERKRKCFPSICARSDHFCGHQLYRNEIIVGVDFVVVLSLRRFRVTLTHLTQDYHTVTFTPISLDLPTVKPVITRAGAGTIHYLFIWDNRRMGARHNYMVRVAQRRVGVVNIK